MIDFIAYFAIVLLAAISQILIKALNINEHWNENGIPGPVPLPFVGNILPILLGYKSYGRFLRDIYEEYPDERVVGIFCFMRPVLLVRDLDLIDSVFIKDFQHFTNRIGVNDITSPVNCSLIFLNGDLWRKIRQKLNTIFTSEKLKKMFSEINSVADNVMCNFQTDSGIVEATDKIRNYPENVMSTTFGMDQADDHTRLSYYTIPHNLSTFLKMSLLLNIPSLIQKCRLNAIPWETVTYYSEALKRALNNRKTSDVTRNDILQEFIEIQKMGDIHVDNSESEGDYSNIKETPELELTDDILVKQAFGFIFPGIRLTNASLLCLLHDIAINTEIQTKVREEVKAVLKLHEGQFTYESLNKMEYLDALLNESLRIGSTVPFLIRTCTKPYKIPDIDYTIETGTNVVVSSYGIHSDSSLYRDPDQIRPERWLGDEKPAKNQFLPWGYGPRICIGMRYASIELKLLIAKLISNYKISMDPIVTKLTYKPRSILNIPSKNLLVNLEKIN